VLPDVIYVSVRLEIVWETGILDGVFWTFVLDVRNPRDAAAARGDNVAEAAGRPRGIREAPGEARGTRRPVPAPHLP